MRRTWIFGLAAVAGLTTGCATHFWTIPDEPLTTEEVCARAQVARTSPSAPGSVGYRSVADKATLTSDAMYDQAISGDSRFSFQMAMQANSMAKQSDGSNDNWSAGSRNPAGNYWTNRCREARERDERGR